MLSLNLLTLFGTERTVFLKLHALMAGISPFLTKASQVFIKYVRIV